MKNYDNSRATSKLLNHNLMRICLTCAFLISAAYNYPNVVNEYGADGQPCCPANTYCPGTLLCYTKYS